MRTRQRLMKLKEWVQAEICRGRIMKAPGPGMDFSRICRQEPAAWIGFAPSRAGDAPGSELLRVTPGILIMPLGGNIRNMEEKRFDRYSGVKRPKELGQSFNVCFQLSVYEPGIRLPGFAEDGKVDPEKVLEGTEEGILTLCDWMDDLKDRLLAERAIPGTDLIFEASQGTYAPLQDGGYIVDKRPIYYGFINASFQCYADDVHGDVLDEFLN